MPDKLLVIGFALIAGSCFIYQLPIGELPTGYQKQFEKYISSVNAICTEKATLVMRFCELAQ